MTGLNQENFESLELNIQDYAPVNFNGECGQSLNKYKKASGILSIEQNLCKVNGGPIENCVQGNNSAKVFNILLERNAGLKDYVLSIDAQGPSGIGSGSLYLAFKDRDSPKADVYYITITSSTRKKHTLTYSSEDPTITDIFWSNESFTIEK